MTPSFIPFSTTEIPTMDHNAFKHPICPGVGLLIHPDFLNGEVVPDDLVLFLSESRLVDMIPSLSNIRLFHVEHSAKRLASYRRRVEIVSESQESGPPLNIHWMVDSDIQNLNQVNQQITVVFFFFSLSLSP